MDATQNSEDSRLVDVAKPVNNKAEQCQDSRGQSRCMSTRFYSSGYRRSKYTTPISNTATAKPAGSVTISNKPHRRESITPAVPGGFLAELARH